MQNRIDLITRNDYKKRAFPLFENTTPYPKFRALKFIRSKDTPKKRPVKLQFYRSAQDIDREKEKDGSSQALEGVEIVTRACPDYTKRPAYTKWLERYPGDEILSEFLTLFIAHPKLREFRCPVTTELIHYAYIDPTGKSYEKEGIERWVKKHGTAPISKDPLRLSDLRPNYVMMTQQAKLYHHLLEKETLNAIQAEGIHCLLQDLKEQLELCFFVESESLLALVKEGEISRRVFIKQLAQLVDALDI